MRQPSTAPLSLAHDVSGLGSTRVVRFGLSVGRDRDEPDDVATGTQDADVSECAGALAGTTPVCAGGGGDAGDERAELPPLPAPLRGRWPGRIVRPKARQGVRAPRAVPIRMAWVLEQYRTRHVGWTVKHFHDHLCAHHGFAWSYTWTKTTVQRAGLVSKAPRRGAHRRELCPILGDGVIRRRREFWFRRSAYRL